MLTGSGIVSVQNLILLALGLAAFIAEVFAFVDALRHSSQSFVAAGKQTKPLWLVILGVAMAIGFVVFWNPLGIVGLISFVAAAVYLADVRPALRAMGGRRWRRPDSPGALRPVVTAAAMARAASTAPQRR